MSNRAAAIGWLGSLIALGTGLAARPAAAMPPVAVEPPSSPYQGLSYGHVDVELPGPGVVSAERQWRGARNAFEHRVSSSGGVRGPVRLWIGNSYGDEKVRVNLDERRGGSREFTVTRLSVPSPALFLGTADDLAALEKLFRAVAPVVEEKTDGGGALSRLQVVASEARVADPCEGLLRTPRAIVVHWGSDRIAPHDCAARGATVLAVGRAAAGFPVGGGAEVAGLPAGSFWPHGAGYFAWTEDLAGAAALLAQSDFPVRNHYENNWSNPSRSFWHLQQELAVDADEAEPRAADHRRSVSAVYLTMALFIAYVLAAVVAGIVVSRRPRRPWVTWAWFPALSGVATLALVLFGQGWTGAAGRASVGQVLLVAPSGAGNATRWVHLFGERSVAFEVEAPFARGIPLHFARGQRFGSPLTSAVGPIRLDENVDRGVLRLSGLTVNRRGDADVGWFEPVHTPIAGVVRVPGGLEIENRAGAELQDTVLCLAEGPDGKPLSRAVGRLIPGSKALVPLIRSGEGVRLLNGLSDACTNVPKDGFVLLGKLVEPAGGAGGDGAADWTGLVRIFPSVPVMRKTLFLVVGALPPEPAALEIAAPGGTP